MVQVLRDRLRASRVHVSRVVCVKVVRTPAHCDAFVISQDSPILYNVLLVLCTTFVVLLLAT